MGLDKKAKKRIKALRQRIQKLHQMLAGAKAQQDEPGEVQRIQDEIASCEQQIKQFQGA